MIMRAILFASALSLVGLGACGQNPPGVLVPDALNSSPKPVGAGAPAPPNWTNPILGVPVGSVDEAKAQLAFSPLVPQGLGTATIHVQLGSSDIRSRPIAFIYDHASYGRIVVREWLPNKSPAEYEAWLQSIPGKAAADPGADQPGAGHSELVTIRGGIVALLTEPDDGSIADLRWVERGLVLHTSGPALNRERVIAIANSL